MTIASTAVEYRAPGETDRSALRAMARRCFSDTFGDLYDRDPFMSFLDDAFGAGGSMAADLRDRTVSWQAAFADREPVGYAKLTPLRAPARTSLPGALELQQIYVLRQWHGTGVAERLMKWALATATRARAPELFLTVFDHNERAKRFYARHGFDEVGRCTFTLGDRVDDDRIWRRPMN